MRIWAPLACLFAFLVIAAAMVYPFRTRIFPGLNTAGPIKIGILHSLTGTMAASEKPVVDAVLMAVDEINDAGGVLGRPLEPVVVDGASDLPTFARGAEKLITKDKVSVIFGCWTSASRKTVKPVIEKHDHLLFYPVQYEGMEQSPNIVYTGAAPNQQIIPGVKWAFTHLGRRFFLVGSDYVFPRMANRIIRDQVKALGGTIVGEEYVPLGSKDMEKTVWKIVSAAPDVILNTINGDSNAAFFGELRAAGITPDRIPTVSFSIAEAGVLDFGIENLVGDYAAWNYFQTIDSDENRRFVTGFRERYGPKSVTDDPMEAAWFGVHLWKLAVEEAGTDNPGEVRRTVEDQSMLAPEGLVFVDPETLHTWRSVRIGRIRRDGQFEIMWTSGRAVRPIPFPTHRSKKEWTEMLNGLFEDWGGHWSAPQVAD